MNSSGIDPSRPLPIYFQLKTLVMEEITSGRYGPGDRLPTEHEFCERFGISRTPVTRALSELADEGVILRKRRSGTFVNPHWVPRAADRVEIRVVVSDPKWAAGIETFAPEGVDVNLAIVSGLPELHKTLTRAVAEGRAPDIAILDSVWITEFAEAGFLRPLDELDSDWVTNEFEKDFLTPFVNGYRVAGQTYAVPEEANVSGLWIRRDALGPLGGRAPRSWPELVTVATAAREASPTVVSPIVMPGGSLAGETTTYCLLAILASNDVAVLDREGVKLDSSAAVEALRFIRSLVDKGLMPSDIVGFRWDQAIQVLASGQAVASVGGSYEAGDLAHATGSALEDIWETFSFVPFPAGPRGRPATIAGGMVYGIFRQSAHPRLSMRVLEHVVSTTALADRSAGLPTIPPRFSAIDLVVSDNPFVSETARLLETAFVRPATPSYHLMSVQIQAMLEAVVTGRIRPAAAAERTAEIIGAITGRPVVHD